MRFRNITNGYEITGGNSASPIFALLFGPLYFLVKGVWSHAVISLVAAIMTFGLSWVIYPFFASSIINAHYMRNGWVRVTSSGDR